MNPRRARISDYGLIGNCRTAALVSHEGSIDWACFPRFDSESLFASILDDEKGGYFKIAPEGARVGEQEYLEDTNILVTTFTANGGRASLKDAFTVSEQSSGLVPQHEILRILQVHRGEMRFRLELCPRKDYGSQAIALRRIGRWGIECSRGRKLLLLQSDLPAERFLLEETGAPAIALQSAEKGTIAA